MDRATVYIPTLTGGEALRDCLLSLRAQTLPVEIVVADNSSSRACQTMLESEFPEVTRVAMGGNRGFGPALNRAIAQHGSGPVILVNDDAVADPGFTAAMVEAASTGPEMVAGVLVSDTDDSIIDSAGIEVDETAMGYDYLSGQPVEAARTAPPPAAPTGGGALYSREAFDRVGGFDERIFLYYEDLDLGLRIRAAGGNCVLAPEARLRHAYSQTLGALSAAKFSHTGWSRGYMMRTYGLGRKPALLARAVLVEALVCLGQLVKKRTLSGAVGRVRGWRAAAANEPRPLDAEALTQLSFHETLSRRLNR